MKFSMKFGAFLFLGTAPVVGAEQHRDGGGMEIVGEGAVGAQRLLQLVDGEAGIGGEEGARRVDGFEHDFTAAAAAHAEAEDAEQFAGGGRFAIIDLDGVRVAGQLFELARLGEVAVDQLQVLGLFQRFVAVRGLVAVGDDVARQRGQDVGRVGLGGDGGHAGEGAQRAGDGGGAFTARSFRCGWIAEGNGFAAGGAVGLEVGGGGIAVAGEEIEEGEAAGDCGGTGGIAAIAQGGEKLGVCVAGAGVAVAIEELRIRGPCGTLLGLAWAARASAVRAPMVSPDASIF